ncbi:glycerol-3-phosphate acyltransferase [Mesoplasma tabanidae]|uniref:Glycerol-3-phosphate acyltransferase n=1 Tax=Mesoplasma tabanidae TaxID=219745 RepID=A0A2K8P493_9MOLU|nr:glycerol-3-phosphate acyltransferase [Mesoplasma tabanidae]ATZ21574.1 glycerol-3-phosphate acyltransferase PlsY [Mesoplasma tabanidae]
MFPYLGIIIASIFGYLLGSVLWSVPVTRWVKGVSIYEVGSNNPGATNTVRILGKRWGLAVALLDGFKVLITAAFAIGLSMIPNELFSKTSYFIPCIFVLIGHCWPIWFKFRGGKAVSCFLGLLIVVNYLYFLIFFIVWWIFAFKYRKVSLSSIIGTATILLLMWLPWTYGVMNYSIFNGYDSFIVAWNEHIVFSFYNFFHKFSSEIHGTNFADGMLTGQIVILIGMVILVLRHKTNIIKLKNKTEEPIYPKKQKNTKM